MSAIFETEFRDLEYVKDGETRKAKASTAKLVLLALADHANDYGESSYPGYDKLETKTALSRQGLADTIEALKYNGLLIVDVRGSRLGTNDYTINIRSFPPMYKEAESLPELVKPLDQAESSHLTTPSQATGLEPSINHQLNNGDKSPHKTNELPLEWKILAGQEVTEVPDIDDARRKDAANLIATGMGSKSPDAYAIAYEFMRARQIVIPHGNLKGQRKPVKAMLDSKVKPEHIRKAVEELTSKNMTITDLFSVSKTAMDLANKPQTQPSEYETL